MEKTFSKIAKIALVLVYLVIIAGALVRMTGSGMGCPDWPKCFGYYIPPTDEKELLWSTNHEYKKGQVIIMDKKLLVAKQDFKTDVNFEPSNWEAYTKHDYAIFNVYHTWTEYLNRLCGALAGLGCLAMAIYSLYMSRKSKKIPVLSWLVVFGMGFQAWLGATVVYSVLNPLKITVHMLVALLIVALILYIIHLASPKNNNRSYFKSIHYALYISLFFTLIQVVLGTQVREFVDHQVKDGITNSMEWLKNPTLDFYIHRSFSILVMALNIWIFVKIKRLNLGLNKIKWVLGMLLMEVFSGMLMFYNHFPFGSQTVHLLIASILFGLQYYLILETKKQ